MVQLTKGGCQPSHFHHLHLPETYYRSCGIVPIQQYGEVASKLVAQTVLPNRHYPATSLALKYCMFDFATGDMVTESASLADYGRQNRQSTSVVNSTPKNGSKMNNVKHTLL